LRLIIASPPDYRLAGDYKNDFILPLLGLNIEIFGCGKLVVF